jgi:hypothetical protein
VSNLRFRRRVNRNRELVVLAFGFILLVLVVFGINSLFSTSEHFAEEVVRDFYEYESEGEFSSSWSLFHSKMKERFTKGHYIQDRAHVFMNHFGVETFSYKLGPIEEVKDWKMSNDDIPFKLAYKLTVTQTYKGKYANFDLVQDIFVVEEKGKWKIVWDYKQ